MVSVCVLPSFHAHSAQFMARLQQDLATRETRVQELQNKWAKSAGQGWELVWPWRMHDAGRQIGWAGSSFRGL